MRTPASNTPTNSASLSPYTPAHGAVSGPFAFGPYPPSAPAAKADSPTFGGLFHALKRRWVLGTFLGLLVAVAAAAVTLFSLPSGKHLARAILYFPRSAGTDDSHRVFKDKQYQSLRSRTVIHLTLNKIDTSKLTMLHDAEDKPRFIEESMDIRWLGDDTLRVSMTGDNKDELKLLLDTFVKALQESTDSHESKQKVDRLLT